MARGNKIIIIVIQSIPLHAPYPISSIPHVSIPQRIEISDYFYCDLIVFCKRYINLIFEQIDMGEFDNNFNIQQTLDNIMFVFLIINILIKSRPSS